MRSVDSLEKTLMLGGIGAGGEGDDRGWDGWMVSPTRWTWVWVNSGSWWWTGRPAAAAAAKSLQSWPTLCDPIHGSPPGYTDHGILQARILQWVAISFSRGSSWPMDWTLVSWTWGRFLTDWTTREAQWIRYIFIYTLGRKDSKCRNPDTGA